MIKNKKILILGMARSGLAIAKLLAKFDNDITITDLKKQDKSVIEELNNLNIKVEIKEHQEDLVNDTFDYVIKNPAIKKDNLAVLKAKSLNIPVINEMEACYDLIPQDVCIIGITGSNGKTTTTTIVYELLKTTKKKVFVGGNIGIPLASFVLDIRPGDIVVLEISDHQLCDMFKFKTNISVLTNLSEVHLDFHDSFAAYKNIKKKIFNNHTASDLAILNQENQDVLDISKDIASQKVFFSSKNKADIYLDNDQIIYRDEVIIKTNEIKIQGTHNYENIMIGIIIAKMFGVTNLAIKDFLKDFGGVEHRIEFVRELNERKFYNDSKATNNKSTIIALDSFKDPTILIMGGLDRNIPFDNIAPHLTNVKAIVCYGETKYKIKEFADKNKKDVYVVNNLTEATKKAYELSATKDIILLSPACASWDQYPDFETRGNEFKKIVNDFN